MAPIIIVLSLLPVAWFVAKLLFNFVGGFICQMIVMRRAAREEYLDALRKGR